MTVWENLLILKNKEWIMNFEILPCDVLTKRFVIGPIEGVWAAATHPMGDSGSRDTVENGGHLPLEHVP